MLATKWKVGCQRFLDQNMQFKRILSSSVWELNWIANFHR